MGTLAAIIAMTLATSSTQGSGGFGNLDPIQLHNTAIAALAADDLINAKAALDLLVEQSAGDARSRYLSQLAFVQADLGELQAGLETMEQVTTEAPKHGDGWNSLCWYKSIYDIQADTALSDCQIAIRINSENPRYYDSRGFVHLKAGEYERAIEDYDRALSLRPNYGYALYGRGVAQLRLGRDVEADVDMRQALEIEPNIGARYEEIGIAID